MSIVVTGATGHLGRHVVEQLLEKVPADKITAVARTVEKAADFAARGVKIALADYNAPDSFDGLFAAGDKVLLISGNEFAKGRVQPHKVVIEAAKAAGVALLAYRPNTSTARHLFLPGTFFEASLPVVSAGTPTAAWMLWVSRTTRLGSANRFRLSRSCQRRRS